MTDPSSDPTSLLVMDYTQWVGPIPANGLSPWQMAQAIEGAKQRAAGPPVQVQQPKGPTLADFEALCRTALGKARSDVEAAADWLVTLRKEQPYLDSAAVLDLGFRTVLSEYLGRMTAKTKNKR